MKDHPSIRAILTIVVLLGIIAFLVIVGAAHAQEPTAVFSVLPGAPVDPVRSQSVNVPGDKATACACALGGAEGACFVHDQLLKLRDKAGKELPSCQRTVGNKDVELRERATETAAVRAALAACQAQTAALGSANLERQQAAKLTEQAAKPAEPGWWERHGVGVAAALGVLSGAAATVGIMYAILPARPAAGTSTAGLHRPTTPPAFSLVRW